MNKRRIKWVKRVIRWSLVIVVVAYIVTGFGITEARTVESLTFGLLNKYWAFKIHLNLEIPFISLLALHILLSPAIRAYSALGRRFSIEVLRHRGAARSGWRRGPFPEG